MAQKTIRIDSGTVTVAVQIDDGPIVDITFNPNDKLFAERLHAFYFETKEKLEEILKRDAAASSETEVDENEMPLKIEGMMTEYEEMNTWLREKIDVLLGEGTAQKIYGDTVFTGAKLDVYLQLFNGMFEIASPQREQRVKKYVKRQR